VATICTTLGNDGPGGNCISLRLIGVSSRWARHSLSDKGTSGVRSVTHVGPAAPTKVNDSLGRRRRRRRRRCGPRRGRNGRLWSILKEMA